MGRREEKRMSDLERERVPVAPERGVAGEGSVGGGASSQSSQSPD